MVSPRPRRQSQCQDSCKKVVSPKINARKPFLILQLMTGINLLIELYLPTICWLLVWEGGYSSSLIGGLMRGFGKVALSRLVTGAVLIIRSRRKHTK